MWAKFPNMTGLLAICRTVNVEKCPAHWRPFQDINKTNVLTNIHDDWAKIVTSRVLTRFFYSQIGKTATIYNVHIEKNAPHTGGHVFSPIWTIFELIGQTLKTASPTSGHVFQQTGTTFELNQDIIKTNILTNFELGRDFIGAKLQTKFHEDRTTNVASRVFTSKCLPTDGPLYNITRVLTRKNALPPGSHVFQPTRIIFELVQDINGMNLLTKFHKDRTINVPSRVLTRFYYSHIRKNAPPLGSHVFQAKFHDDRKINVTSRVLTRKNAPPPGGHVFQPTSIIF
ncbi:hypothetical protein DPMN_009665 [Dreissena polymorpha]|uniref:Uncharacterized protein n=1 Tax=Dreissena polymorpha TaxID=45954 RepID=A0A9D4N0Q5_DREPO|nr:hypothetical protein DPMN_009665 [Dreissena polymorpha]